MPHIYDVVGCPNCVKGRCNCLCASDLICCRTRTGGVLVLAVVACFR